MIKTPWKAVKSRIEKSDMLKDTRDELTKQYFNDRDISISGTLRARRISNGSLTRSDAPLLMGATDGSKVYVKSYANRIEMELMNRWLSEPRSIEIVRDGVIHWQGFFLKDDAPDGLGTRMAATSLLSASALGLKRAEVMAWGPPNYNGHYTWARIGFDVIFDSVEREQLKCAGFYNVQSVADLMGSDSGRNWWKKNGWQIEMTFNLDANSKSMQTLLNYLTSKGVKL